ncbi:MAG TPA: hypothetical protein PLQ20_02370 [Candidatus Paceibacterota bacterium]|nr:hypothetical protein [Candidatus Paceibacterota bacterium]
MFGKIFAIIISLLVLWLLVMFLIFRETHKKETNIEIKQISNKYIRESRKFWFLFLRGVSYLRDFTTKIIAKIFFYIFPKAKTVFEKKDELAGLEHGPSSFFLMSISEDKTKPQKKARRKTKNV